MREIIFIAVIFTLLSGCSSAPFQPVDRDVNKKIIAGGPDNPYKPNTVIVVSSPGFPWAAENVAKVLNANAVAQDISLYEAYNHVLYNENVIGLVEVVVNVDQLYEVVYAICRNNETQQVWKETRIVNFAGGRETLARSMVGALVQKVSGKSCP